MRKKSYTKPYAKVLLVGSRLMQEGGFDIKASGNVNQGDEDAKGTLFYDEILDYNPWERDSLVLF